MSKFVSNWNFVAEFKRVGDRLFFMLDGIYEKLAEDSAEGLQAACEEALPVLREYALAHRKFFKHYRNREWCSAESKVRTARLVARIGVVLQAGARGATVSHLRQLETFLACDK